MVFWPFLIRFLLKNVTLHPFYPPLGPNKDCPAQVKVPKRAGYISQCVIAPLQTLTHDTYIGPYSCWTQNNETPAETNSGHLGHESVIVKKRPQFIFQMFLSPFWDWLILHSYGAH